MGETHEFDAGTMGCTEGLPQEFKRQISAIPAGDVLVVTARDPVAKDDLPALARVFGELVESGGEVWLCNACTKPRGITEEHLVLGASIVGAARVVEEIANGAKAMSFA